MNGPADNFEAAVKWLEDPNRMRRAFLQRNAHNHQRPIFQILTDHEFVLSEQCTGMSEEEFAASAWGVSTSIQNLCSICGSNPIILGADHVDTA